MKKNIITVKTLDDGTVVRVLPDGSTQKLEDRTDWQRLEAMSDEEVESTALSDADNPPLTQEELVTFQPVPNLKDIRLKLSMTQEEFATRFHVPLGTLRDWEQGAREPDSAAKSYLRVIAHNPDMVLQALNH